MIQEHWLKGTQLDRFSNIFHAQVCMVKPQLILPRYLLVDPMEDVVLFIKNYLHSCTKIIPTLPDRFCCVSLTLSRSCIVYIRL